MPSRDPCRFEAPAACLLAILSAAIPALSGCGHGAAETSKRATKSTDLPEIRAAVVRVEPTLWPATVRTQGSLIADEITVVSAKVAGRVNQVNFDLGDHVPGGSIIATLDQAEFQLEVALAEAQLVQSRSALGLLPGDPTESLDPINAPPVREAKAVWDETRARVARIRQLLQSTRNAVTQEEYDQAVAAEGAAEARHAAAINAVREKVALIHVRTSELNVAKQRLTETVIHAPFDGLIQERHVALGSFVQIGSPLVTLVRTSVVRFRGTIPERYAHRLVLGQQVRLKIEGVAEPRIAQVTRISPGVETASRSLAFEALVNNADGSLRAGLFAEAEVVIDPNAQTLIVPRSALVEFAGTEKVWKVVNGQSQEQLVQTARRTEQIVEITSGLAAGDEVVANAVAVEGKVAKIIPIFEEALPATDADPAEGAETFVSEETVTDDTVNGTSGAR